MDRPQERDDVAEPDAGEPVPVEDIAGRSPSRLMNSLMLILIGASLGVFWREVFQLTIRAIEMIGR